MNDKLDSVDEPVIEFANVTYKVQSKTILDSLSLSIKRGELFVLTGIAGSGKSSLLKLAAGLITRYAGKIFIEGKNIPGFTKKEMLRYHHRSGFVFQNSALISSMSVFDNLSLFYLYHTSMTEREIKERLVKLVSGSEIYDELDERPETLSTGEQMLINIFRAISHEPEFIFWDEPTENLDQISAGRVVDIIFDMKKKGKTMILTTHDPELAFAVGDRIGVLGYGCILESGTPAEMKNSEHTLVRKLLGSIRPE